MIDRKAKVVETTCGGIDFLMKKNKVTVYQGYIHLKIKMIIVKKKIFTEEILETK